MRRLGHPVSADFEILAWSEAVECSVWPVMVVEMLESIDMLGDLVDLGWQALPHDGRELAISSASARARPDFRAGPPDYRPCPRRRPRRRPDSRSAVAAGASRSGNRARHRTRRSATSAIRRAVS